MPNTLLPPLPEYPSHWEGGRKVTLEVRKLKFTYTQALITRAIHPTYAVTPPSVWIPLSQVSFVDLNYANQGTCIMPLWLYRKIQAQLSA